MKNGFTGIEVAESHLPSAWMAAKRSSLENGEIAPAFHYATARQANLWIALFRRYSPFAGSEGREFYRRAAREAVALLAEGPGQLISLGCGTGEKDLVVYTELRARSWKPDWICVDGSLSLLLEAGRVSRGGGGGARLVLADVLLPDLLERIGRGEGEPRLVTAFGLLPNLSAESFLRALRAQLFPRDLLLLGTNLVPVAAERAPGYRESAARILTQYANRPTRLWLTELLRDWGISDLVEDYRMRMVEGKGCIRYEATVRWKRSREVPLEDGSSVRVGGGENLRLFSSCRFAREELDRLLRASRFDPLCYWTTPSGEEGIWLAAPSPCGAAAG
ncbi:conserved protein of unknown function [Methylacidimicrobium sp. AP8]|uniref:L-histidine N(alpha)-methyltransferase n=1 Tax=Methylacidimicrobium sp. AP8 TaxID=2730359 RepID=UPI0018C08FE4|nr:L-histidine N(alpha)-methyltransferase [Methylacidimicrobium sp. AP8]CAB4244682.1 conserved protein of unknown function [Methylacidimicrobium sp. AP8]